MSFKVQVYIKWRKCWFLIWLDKYVFIRQLLFNYCCHLIFQAWLKPYNMVILTIWWKTVTLERCKANTWVAQMFHFIAFPHPCAWMGTSHLLWGREISKPWGFDWDEMWPPGTQCLLEQSAEVRHSELSACASLAGWESQGPKLSPLLSLRKSQAERYHGETSREVQATIPLLLG